MISALPYHKHAEEVTYGKLASDSTWKVAGAWFDSSVCWWEHLFTGTKSRWFSRRPCREHKGSSIPCPIWRVND